MYMGILFFLLNEKKTKYIVENIIWQSCKDKPLLEVY
jgi:hypothetical protein